jgi:hypothetical protein
MSSRREFITLLVAARRLRGRSRRERNGRRCRRSGI